MGGRAQTIDVVVLVLLAGVVFAHLFLFRRAHGSPREKGIPVMSPNSIHRLSIIWLEDNSG